MLPDHIYMVKRTAKCIYTSNQVEAALDTMAIEMEAQLAETNPGFFMCCHWRNSHTGQATSSP